MEKKKAAVLLLICSNSGWPRKPKCRGAGDGGGWVGREGGMDRQAIDLVIILILMRTKLLPVTDSTRLRNLQKTWQGFGISMVYDSGRQTH